CTSVTRAAFTIASEASTMATKPLVSIKPRASSCITTSAAGGVRSGRRRAPHEHDGFEFRDGTRDDMAAQEFAERGGCRSARSDRGLDVGQLAADEDRDQRLS